MDAVPTSHSVALLPSLVFVTGSKAKWAEAERILAAPLDRVDLDLPEVQHTDVEEVVGAKAAAAWQALGRRPVLVEDTGLALHAWGGLPGALVKWFMKTVGADGLCRMLADFPDRSATATTIVAVHDGKLRVFCGAVRGQIAQEPRGSHGFGWDSVFIPDGSTYTFAEMGPEEKDRFSMRRLALEAMAVGLSG